MNPLSIKHACASNKTLLIFYEFPTRPDLTNDQNCDFCATMLHNVHKGVIPLEAISDRKRREAIGPCATCKTLSMCSCLQCDCCKQTIKLIAAEQQYLNDPTLDFHPDFVKRFKELNPVPTKEVSKSVAVE